MGSFVLVGEFCAASIWKVLAPCNRGSSWFRSSEFWGFQWQTLAEILSLLSFFGVGRKDFTQDFGRNSEKNFGDWSLCPAMYSWNGVGLVQSLLCKTFFWENLTIMWRALPPKVPNSSFDKGHGVLLQDGQVDHVNVFRCLKTTVNHSFFWTELAGSGLKSLIPFRDKIATFDTNLLKQFPEPGKLGTVSEVFHCFKSPKRQF